jgi:enoyl-CoA hydratase/carnithine racemase
MNYQHILYEVSDKIATITLNRPDRMNAWTATMERDVRHAMEAAAGDDSVRVIVLTGAGRAFCAPPIWRPCRLSIPARSGAARTRRRST